MKEQTIDVGQNVSERQVIANPTGIVMRRVQSTHRKMRAMGKRAYSVPFHLNSVFIFN